MSQLEVTDGTKCYSYWPYKQLSFPALKNPRALLPYLPPDPSIWPRYTDERVVKIYHDHALRLSFGYSPLQMHNNFVDHH